MWFNY
ncbi:hypothetical protein RDI58_024745 [Solanum bulbocastanum]